MFRNLALWLIISLGLFLVVNQFTSSGMSTSEIAYSEFMEQVEGGYIKSATIKGSTITGDTESGQKYETFAPLDFDMLPVLREHGVKITAVPNPDYRYLMSIGTSLLFIVIFIFMIMRMNSGGGGKAFSFGKSKARMLTPDQQKVTFKDVAGVDEAKEELEEVVEFLKDPDKFQKLGGKIPKGVLLVGSPGTGKTLLARAVAGEAGVSFFSISGSDFVEMFVGVGAARIRDLFEQGKKNAPCIIFMDEIDAVGRHRGAGLGGGHDEREQTLNALLVEMDGFESTQGVILIAATNRPDVLDPALLRPGRFDRQVVVPLPDLKGRRMILDVHAAKVPLADDVNLDIIAKGTSGFSGASLANLVNEAALHAARMNKEKVDHDDFEEARDKVFMGKERRSMVVTEEDKRKVAYHEAGHAIVGKMTKHSELVHKVTIIPRGQALGLTWRLPVDNMHLISKAHYLDRMAMAMGGRAAEMLIYNELTTGASGDIEHVTDIARGMVTAYGMSEKLGPVRLGKQEGSVFLGKELTSAKNFSEHTAQLIDAEVQELATSSYERALDILKANRGLLDGMTEMLIEKETIDMKDIDELIETYATDEWKEVAASNINLIKLKKEKEQAEEAVKNTLFGDEQEGDSETEQ